jgi:hypothetical protein
MIKFGTDCDLNFANAFPHRLRLGAGGKEAVKRKISGLVARS